MTTFCPAAASGSSAAPNGAPTTVRTAPIVLAARLLSASQTARSVRGVGCWSMVSEAPRIHTAWARGATSAGAPASTATTEPGPNRHLQVRLQSDAPAGEPRPSCAGPAHPRGR